MDFTSLQPFVRYISSLEYPTAPSPHWMYGTDRLYAAYDARLLYGLSGSGEVEVDGVRYPMRQGALLLWRSGLPYRYLHTPQKDMAVLRVNFDFTRQNADSAPQPVPPDPAASFQPERRLETDAPVDTLYLGSARALEGVLTTLLSAFESGDASRGMQCSALMQYVLLKALSLRDAETESKPSSRLAQTVCDYIEEHACALSSAQEVGERLSYHPYYLNRVLLREKGKCLHTCLTEAKIRHAVQLLTSSDLSIARVAEICGFCDSSHFSRRFRQVTGFPPSKYRHI